MTELHAFDEANLPSGKSLNIDGLIAAGYLDPPTFEASHRRIAPSGITIDQAWHQGRAVGLKEAAEAERARAPWVATGYMLLGIAGGVIVSLFVSAGGA